MKCHCESESEMEEVVLHSGVYVQDYRYHCKCCDEVVFTKRLKIDGKEV